MAAKKKNTINEYIPQQPSREYRAHMAALRRASKEALKSRKAAIKFLQGAGILDKDGNVAEPYR